MRGIIKEINKTNAIGVTAKNRKLYINSSLMVNFLFFRLTNSILQIFIPNVEFFSPPIEKQ